MNSQQEQIDPRLVQKTLSRLIWLNRESERGFETAASHVKNRGMKILLKTYAGQRARFAAQLAKTAQQHQIPLNSHGPLTPVRKFMATVHRGWIDIKAAMTIGRTNTQRVILSETLRAESRIALRTYEQASQANLPGEIGAIIEEQYARVKDVHVQLLQMAGSDEGRMLVQLYDDSAHAQQAVDQIEALGIDSKNLRVRPVDEIMEIYECDCHGGRVLESTAAGAVSGLVSGILFGLVIAIGIWLGPNVATLGTFISLMGTSGVIGLVIGVIFGALIGQATVEDDSYVYRESIRRGDTLVLVETQNGEAERVQQILRSQRLKADSYASAAA